MKSGGLERNRTAIQGFAILCITTLPPGRAAFIVKADSLSKNNQILMIDFYSVKSPAITSCMSMLARKNMVESQIRPNKVTDARILAAFEAVEREQFVMANQKGFAYVDTDLPTTPGRSIMESMVLARLLQAANIGTNDRVLVVGSDLGYTTAILLHLTPNVTAVDKDAGIMKIAEINLQVCGLTSAHLQVAPIAEGCPVQAPFEVIILNGSAEVVPPALFSQLILGGRLMAVMNKTSPQGVEIGYATRFIKTDAGSDEEVLFETNIPLLPEFKKLKKFKL